MISKSKKDGFFSKLEFPLKFSETMIFSGKFDESSWEKKLNY